ncbi:Maf family nucleotide pyrophosphatase [Psychroflexus montanilacus]|uniref:Maf family nucleotide pyrophosphatase n=1 Tax=Psychroflexus montanilacus TaxID=2873598 RepID=UPI001CCE2B80|nr:Maf family nucleotide pyrophosphatase [Psychroflexus montanilacus]MBZ9651126.1 Maf family nucleotide pyrophosphatase [Psychroflexus montanilacus]
MILKNLKNKRIILASGSPRRQEILKSIGVDFIVELRSVDEVFSEDLKHHQISDYLAQLKARQFQDLRPDDILITGDTIVWHDHKALNKPSNKDEAFQMIQSLSDTTHEVISSFCIKTQEQTNTFYDTTEVKFKPLTSEEIWHYINTYSPFDKAGAYGIQEWIGQIGISEIKGSFYTVMGFPIHLVYEKLSKI